MDSKLIISQLAKNYFNITLEINGEQFGNVYTEDYKTTIVECIPPQTQITNSNCDFFLYAEKVIFNLFPEKEE